MSSGEFYFESQNDFRDLVEKTRVCEFDGCETVMTFQVPRKLGGAGPRYCEVCGPIVDERKDAERRLRLVNDLVKSSTIDDRYRNWDKDIAAATGSDRLLDWIMERRDGSVWIAGTNGIGKTHTVMHAAYLQIRDGARSCYAIRSLRWFNTIMRLRSGLNAARIEMDALVERAKRVSLLIIDDIGKERLSEAKAELLLDVIDYREVNGRAIWITTNFGGKQLKDRMNNAGKEDEHGYGSAALSRLTRMIPMENIVIPKELKQEQG